MEVNLRCEVCKFCGGSLVESNHGAVISCDTCEYEIDQFGNETLPS